MSYVRLINKSAPGAPPPDSKLQLEAVNGAFVVQNGAGEVASFSGVNTGDQSADGVPVETTLNAGVQTVQDIIDTQLSTGIVGDDELISDAGSGTVNVASATVAFRTADDSTAPLTFVVMGDAEGVEPDDGVLSYIYAEYNGGTPLYVATTSERTDTNTNALIGTVYRNGTTVHINNNFRVRANDNLRRVALRFVETMPFARSSGGIVSEVGTRNLHITAGRWWECTNPFTTPTFDSSDADTFTAAYSDGATGWTEQAAQTQADNTYYDDLSGTLAEALPNRYLTRWVYLETDGHVVVVYGRAQHVTEVLAEAEAEPPRLPRIQAAGRLLARIIIRVGASSFTSIKNVDAGIEFTSPTTHNGLAGLQGGTASEYYHLTQAQHQNLPATITAAGAALLGDADAAAQRETLDVFGKTDLDGSVGNLTAPLCHLPLRGPDDAIQLQGDFQYLCESDATYIDRYGVLQKCTYYSGTPTATDGFSITDSGATFGDLSGYVVYLTDGTNVAYRWVDAATATKVLWRKPVAFTPTSYKLSRPRFEKEGLLVEGASTNLFTYSEDMTNAAWAKVRCTVTATKIIVDASELTAHVQHPLASVSGTSYTAWAVFEAAEYSTAWIQVNAGAFIDATALRAEFNLASGTASVVLGTGTASIRQIEGTSRYLCEVRFTATATSSVGVLFQAQGSVASDGTSGLYCHYRQVEALPFASSYIPTTSAAVTRAITNENLPRYGNLPSLYNDFSIITRASFLGYGEDNTLLAVGTDLVVALNSDRKVVVTYNGTTITGTTALDANTEYSIGIGKSGTTITLYIDGVSDGSDTVTPAESSEELIALGHNAGTKHWWGRIAEYRTYDHALSAAEWRLLA